MTVNTSSPTVTFGNISKEGNHDGGYEYDGFKILYALIILISTFGLVGNGIVIWFLSCCIKRNSFTTYIWNLAIADFCSVLIVPLEIIISFPSPFHTDTVSTFAQFVFTHSAGLYLLTIISIQRCVSILFPVWYLCHRPRHSSTLVSCLLWVLSSLLSGMMLLFHFFGTEGSFITLVIIICILNFLVFTPVMVGSTLTLLIKICRNSRLHRPARVYTAILITLLLFIIFAIPFSILTLIKYIHFGRFFMQDSAIPVVVLFASVNSSINPIIYYLVGKQQSRKSLKGALQRLFKDEAEV